MAKRVCPTPGCPTLVTSGYCARCARGRDAARGRRQERGYDAEYDALKRQYQRRMDTGETFDCWRCRELGTPHQVDPADWHLGHDNRDRRIIHGPQCSASNLRDAGRARTPGG